MSWWEIRSCSSARGLQGNLGSKAFVLGDEALGLAFGVTRW